MSKFFVRIDVYDYLFLCLIGDAATARKACQRHFGNKDVTTISFTARGSFLSRAGFESVLWLPRFPRSNAEHGALAHEVGHAIAEMMGHIGLPLSVEADEAFCYAIGFAVEKILERRP